MSDSFATPQTVAHQTPLSMGFPKQEYWSRLPFHSPGDILNPRMEPTPLVLAGRFFTTEPPGKLNRSLYMAEQYFIVYMKFKAKRVTDGPLGCSRL